MVLLPSSLNRAYISLHAWRRARTRCEPEGVVGVCQTRQALHCLCSAARRCTPKTGPAELCFPLAVRSLRPSAGEDIPAGTSLPPESGRQVWWSDKPRLRNMQSTFGAVYYVSNNFSCTIILWAGHRKRSKKTVIRRCFQENRRIEFWVCSVSRGWVVSLGISNAVEYSIAVRVWQAQMVISRVWKLLDTGKLSKHSCPSAGSVVGVQ